MKVFFHERFPIYGIIIGKGAKAGGTKKPVWAIWLYFPTRSRFLYYRSYTTCTYDCVYIFCTQQIVLLGSEIFRLCILLMGKKALQTCILGTAIDNNNNNNNNDNTRGTEGELQQLPTASPQHSEV